MAVLLPGTLLQLMYLRERLGHKKPGRFIEIGPGSGEITRLLLDMGWTGQSYDLEAVTIERLQMRFAKEIEQGLYSAVNADYLSQPQQQLGSADMVISCMVMEHLEEASESAFMRKSSEILSHGGLMIGLVPSSPAHWGIEDDIAGHCRRYTRASIRELLVENEWQIGHLAGLTFPVSNILLPISNYLVGRSEKLKLKFSQLERTKQSGRRSVKFKTHFPSAFELLLNRYMLWPWHQLQKVFADHERALVLYFEAKPDSEAS
jgi:SAM-dependent methyltransferase